MVNDTIAHAQNYADRFCNDVIICSNDFAHFLGMTYGEFWAGLSIFVVFMFVLYNLIILLSIYIPRLKKILKYTYWTIHGIIFLILAFTFVMFVFDVRCEAESGEHPTYTKEMIIN